MRAVIYARYSSENQREASIEDQIRLCKVRIKREEWALTATYADRAVSGAQLLRPGYQNLLQDVRGGKIDVVVAEALDRISRDQEHVAAFFKQLTFAGVKLITIAEGEVNELHVGMKGTMNALFLKDLAAKTHRGLRGRVEEGRSGGGLCFGYDVVTEVDAKGEPSRGGRKINEEEAAIVRRIFSAFAGGRSPRHIAIALNAEGIPGPAGGEWGPSTINGNSSRGTGILNNELYIGRLVWNRLRYIKDPNTGRRVSRLNDPAQWVVQDVPDLRIVPPELWDRVKARQTTTKYGERAEHDAAKPFWDRRRPRFLLSGLAKCGKCGSSYVKATATMFGCSAARDRGTCDNHRHIRIDDLENTVLAGLGQRLLDPELFKEFYRELNKARMEDGAAMQVQSRELDKIGRRIRKIVEIITDDDAPVRSLKGELRELEVRQDQIKGMLATAKSPAPLIHPNLAEIYRRKIESLRAAIADPESRDEAFELIRSLVEAVVVVPVGKELELEIKGDLAGILHLCDAGRKAKPGTVSSAGLAEQLKMVAGAGFEPTTFRL
jgi:site-specific DNA recombinase